MYVAVLQYVNKDMSRKTIRHVVDEESMAHCIIEHYKNCLRRAKLSWTYSTVMNIDLYMESEIDDDGENLC